MLGWPGAEKGSFARPAPPVAESHPEAAEEILKPEPIKSEPIKPEPIKPEPVVVKPEVVHTVPVKAEAVVKTDAPAPAPSAFKPPVVQCACVLPRGIHQSALTVAGRD